MEKIRLKQNKKLRGEVFASPADRLKAWMRATRVVSFVSESLPSMCFGSEKVAVFAGRSRTRGRPTGNGGSPSATTHMSHISLAFGRPKP